MKKSLSLLSAAVLTASCLPFADTNANATAAAASFYMKVPVSDAYELDAETNFIKIDSLDEDITVTANIFFSNPTNSAWSVSPKWKSSDDEYVTITKVNNPFDTPTEPFAYSVKGADGKLSVDGLSSNYSVNSKYNSCNFTVRSQDGRKALTPYGSTSDAYPLISFEFTIDADTPDGRYDIYFTEDADNSTRCAMDATQNHMIYSFPDCPPSLSNLTITIGADESSAISLQGKSVEAAPGEKVEVDFVINASENTTSGISGVFFKVDTDEKLSFVSAKFADAFNPYSVYNTKTGEVAFANPEGNNISASNGDTLVTLTFEVPANATKGDVYKIGLNGLEIVNNNGVNITSNAAIQPAEIKISDSLTPNIGDINLDGKVDSSDASMALAEYALIATGSSSSLNAQQKLNGDVNFNGATDSTDASDILAYYAYTATTTDNPIKTFLEYFNRKLPV